MKVNLYKLIALVAILAAISCLDACKKDSTDKLAVFLPTEKPYGKSYEEWSELWTHEFYSFDCETIPWVHPENVLFYTTGPVYILAGIAEVGGSADITIPKDKAIFFPLVNVLWDYPCVGDTTFVPAPGQTVEELLTAGVESSLTNIDVSSLAVTVDDEVIADMGSYKFVTGQFDFTGHPSLVNCFDSCITGEPQPGVMGGYYVMVKPLSKGQHTVHYHMEAPNWGAVQDGTYNITVQ